MDEEKWDEELIESSLKKLPNIQDERSKEEILRRLQKDDRLQEEMPLKKKSFNWLPVAIGIAAVFFVMLLLPSVQMGEQKADEAAMIMHDSETRESVVEEGFAVLSDGGSHVVLQLAETEQYVQLDMRSGEEIIPVTFIVPAADADNESSLFERYASEIDVHGLGFDGYLDQSVEFGTASYFKTALPNGRFYLLPKEQPAMGVKEALLNMKKPPNTDVESVIPSSIQYDVEVTEETAIIRFQEPLDLTLLDQEAAILFIEGFMLTAKQFNLQIKFENMMQPDYGQYHLSEPLPIPIAANPIYFYN